MKGLFLHIVFLFVIGGVLKAQEIQLSNQVLGSMGSSISSSDLQLSFTSGEVITGTTESEQRIYTQGFHQPINVQIGSISYSISIQDETCSDTEDGAIKIDSLMGCETGMYTIEWDDGNTNFDHRDLKSGYHYFTISACGRSYNDSAYVGLVYENSCKLIFYTAFSPNGDGKNDTWEIDNITSTFNQDNEIIFYNRWGDQVRKYNNYDNLAQVWDGKNDGGIDLTEGTYYYVLKIRNEEFTGYIELTR